MRFVLGNLIVLIWPYSFQHFRNMADLNVKERLQIPFFDDLVKVCIFHKKTVTCTESPPTERLTYPDIFHKKFKVSQEQVFGYFLCSTLTSYPYFMLRQSKLILQQGASQVKASNLKNIFLGKCWHG